MVIAEASALLLMSDQQTTCKLEEYTHKRICDWVLPNDMIALHHADPSTARYKSRPDIMVVELSQTEQQDHLRNSDKAKQTLPTYVGTQKRTVWILEERYFPDVFIASLKKEDIFIDSANTRTIDVT